MTKNGQKSWFFNFLMKKSIRNSIFSVIKKYNFSKEE